MWVQKSLCRDMMLMKKAYCSYPGERAFAFHIPKQTQSLSHTYTHTRVYTLIHTHPLITCITCTSVRTWINQVANSHLSMLMRTEASQLNTLFTHLMSAYGRNILQVCCLLKFVSAFCGLMCRKVQKSPDTELHTLFLYIINVLHCTEKLLGSWTVATFSLNEHVFQYWWYKDDHN